MLGHKLLKQTLIDLWLDTPLYTATVRIKLFDTFSLILLRHKQNKTKQNKTKQNKTKQNRTEQNRTEQNRTEQNKSITGNKNF